MGFTVDRSEIFILLHIKLFLSFLTRTNTQNEPCILREKFRTSVIRKKTFLNKIFNFFKLSRFRL